MHAVLEVRRFGIGPVQVVRRIGHIAVGQLGRGPGATPSQRAPAVVELLAHRLQTMLLLVGQAAGLARPPQALLLLDEAFDSVEDGLLIHVV